MRAVVRIVGDDLLDRPAISIEDQQGAGVVHPRPSGKQGAISMEPLEDSAMGGPCRQPLIGRQEQQFDCDHEADSKVTDMTVAVSTDTADLRGTFARVPLFAAMPESTRNDLWNQVRVRTAPRGDIVISQGSATDSFHVLLRGEATSIRATSLGRCVSLARWTAPMVIDKVTMFTESHHPASVLADTSATWCEFPFAAVQAAVETNPSAQQHALTRMAAAAREARESFVDAAVRSTTARLARWLVVTMDVGVPIGLPRPQERLALQLGMTRVSLNRALHRLVAREVIELAGSVVIVLDPTSLRQLADL